MTDLELLVHAETEMANHATRVLKQLAAIEQCPELFEQNEIESLQEAVTALVAFGPCRWW